MIRLKDVKVRLQYRVRVRQRLMVLHFAGVHGPTAAARRYGVSARTIRRWRVRWRQGGLEGLVRTQLWLRRRHDVRIAMGTIQRLFRDFGVPRLRKTRKRTPRQMTLFEKAEPGESVQVDVKFLKIGGRWVYQYTAIDDCTRFRVLRLYRHLHQSVSLAFLAEIRRAMPFPIRKLQCDNGREFALEFVFAVEAAGIRHRYIRPRRPQQNGKVERSHRIDQEEFWGRQKFTDFDEAATGVAPVQWTVHRFRNVTAPAPRGIPR